MTIEHDYDGFLPNFVSGKIISRKVSLNLQFGICLFSIQVQIKKNNGSEFLFHKYLGITGPLLLRHLINSLSEW